MTLRLLLALALLREPSGTITGRVSLPGGAPAVGVRIGALPLSDDPAAITAPLLSPTQTDTTGSYRLERLPPGRYYVVTGAAANADEIIVVRAGSVSEAAPIRNYLRDVTISGRFVPPPAMPATVGVHNFGRLVQVPVSPDGSFELVDIPQGSYSLELREDAEPVVRVGGLDATGDVRGLVAMRGRVSFEDDSQMFARPSYLRPAVEASAVRSLIHPDGSFILLLREGSHRIGLRHLPFEYGVRAMTSGNVDLVTTPLEVAPAVSLSEIRVSLEKRSVTGVKVGGHLTGLIGDVKANVPVYLIGGVPGHNVGTTITKPDGTFEFSAVQPGAYVVVLPDDFGKGAVVVNPESWSVVVGAEDIHGLEFSGQVVDGFVDSLPGNIAPDKVPRISGRFNVIDPSGASLPVPSGVMIRLSNNLTSIRPDGTFSVPAGDGTHNITFAGLPPGYVIRSMTYGATDLMKSSLVLGTARPSQDLDVTFEFASQQNR
jgi:hypothetical protein